MHCQRKEKELKSEISEDTTDSSCVEMNCYLKIFLKNNIKNTRQDSNVKKLVLSILYGCKTRITIPVCSAIQP